MERILIIEDDADIAEIEKDYLALSGYSVDIESDGNGGLFAATNGKYDLILLDLMLPGIDGLEICRRIRDKTKVPILMVTAKITDLDKIRGLGLGADDYIEKPFSPSVLVARVKAYCAIQTVERKRRKGNRRIDGGGYNREYGRAQSLQKGKRNRA